jgi:hypothetical protein
MSLKLIRGRSPFFLSFFSWAEALTATAATTTKLNSTVQNRISVSPHNRGFARASDRPMRFA